ncbi:hypothetical protein H5410_057212 [Solanum commersonii]|uniref:Uncharacterized protein n=1 Tax=Solanum commersonii TaxID=4109 RepID=A0A9J5WQ82_SOLCO|nr:hypothetical protein H5410_057212 [Solanum commersonii]
MSDFRENNQASGLNCFYPEYWAEQNEEMERIPTEEEPTSIRKMMKILREYEFVSGQLINLDKSLMYLHEKVPIGVSFQIRRKTELRMGSFPFTYLGCLMFYGRKNKTHFEGINTKYG